MSVVTSSLIEDELGDQALAVQAMFSAFNADQHNVYALVDGSGRVVAANHRLRDLVAGLQDQSTLLSLRRLFGESYSDEIEPLVQVCLAGEAQKTSHRVFAQRADDSSAIPVDLSFLPYALGDAQYALVIGHDISRHKNLERKLRQMAHLDPLTQLPNLRFIDYQLRKLKAQSSRDGSGFSVVFIDFNHFKKINDTYGHAAGDQVLIEFSRRLRTKLRAGEHIARIGGDEFLVVVRESLDDEQKEALVSRLKSLVARPFSAGAGQVVPLGISVGVATWPLDGGSLEELKQLADARMYIDKQQA